MLVTTPGTLVSAPSVQPCGLAREASLVRVGLIGCGAFSRFSMHHYRTLPGVSIDMVADIQPDAAHRAAAELGAKDVAPETILACPDIDLIYKVPTVGKSTPAQKKCSPASAIANPTGVVPHAN